MISIRPAQLDDVATLVDFNIAMAAESEAKGLDPATLRLGIEAVLDNAGHGFYLVAQTVEQSVGALLVTYEWSDWRNGKFWWIQSVFVVPAWRRRGVYRELHEHVRRLARNDPSSCGIRLYVERDNRGAQATYAAMGMSETAYRLYQEEWPCSAVPR